MTALSEFRLSEAGLSPRPLVESGGEECAPHPSARTAGAGSTRPERLDKGGYDIVLLDLTLPGIDGLTLLVKMRRHGDGTFVMIISARDRHEERVRGLGYTIGTTSANGQGAGDAPPEARER